MIDVYKQIICEKCSKRCILDIDKYEENIEVLGNECDKGIEYAKMEINNTKEILTTLVRMKGSNKKVVPVKTKYPVDKKLFIELSKVLSRLYVGAPIKIGDVVCKNILNTGIDVVATKNIFR